MDSRSTITRPVAIPSASPDRQRRPGGDDGADVPDRRPAWVQRLDSRIVVTPDLPSALRVDRPLR